MRQTPPSSRTRDVAAAACATRRRCRRRRAESGRTLQRLEHTPDQRSRSMLISAARRAHGIRPRRSITSCNQHRHDHTIRSRRRVIATLAPGSSPPCRSDPASPTHMDQEAGGRAAGDLLALEHARRDAVDPPKHKCGHQPPANRQQLRARSTNTLSGRQSIRQHHPSRRRPRARVGN